MSKLGTMVVIGVDGEITEKVLDAGNPDYLLATIRVALDDYLELVPRFLNWQGHKCVAFCGETGKLKGLKPNTLATELWRVQVANYDFVDFLVGPVVVVYGPPAFMRAL